MNPFADHAPQAGVHHLPAAHAEALLSALAAGGRDVHHVDLHDCADKAAVLERLAAALHFPGHFGHNWDALADCLGDLGWLHDDAIVVLVSGLGTLHAHSPADHATLLDIFAEVAAQQAAAGTCLAIYVLGAPE